MPDDSGTDPIYVRCQDEYFQKCYFKSVLDIANNHRFFLPLSMLVIIASYLHNGSVPTRLCIRFSQLFDTQTDTCEIAQHYFF